MNPAEYLITGFLVVMTIGAWVLITAFRRAEDAFENELGFQLGIAPPVKLLDPLPAYYVPAAPTRAVVPETTLTKSRRRTPGSKPPMLPANLTVADFNPRPTGRTRRGRKTADSNPPITPETQAAFRDIAGTPSTQ